MQVSQLPHSGSFGSITISSPAIYYSDTVKKLYKPYEEKIRNLTALKFDVDLSSQCLVGSDNLGIKVLVKRQTPNPKACIQELSALLIPGQNKNESKLLYKMIKQMTKLLGK